MEILKLEMVSFLTPNNSSTTTAETYRAEQIERDPEKIEGVYEGTEPFFGVQFYSNLWTNVQWEGEEMALISDNFNYSPIIYMVGKKIHVADLIHHFPTRKADEISHYMNVQSIKHLIKHGSNAWPFYEENILWSDPKDREKYYESIK